MRNKLQRGVFKLNMRSPKGEKKQNGIFRPVKTESLYLEGGIPPVFPIFGASLEELEMNESIHPNVPRFVVDCVSYIERKDCILQDGLYRASGNKLAIDDLKKKLSESYIYDSKLLVADDIHTITSLLKQFFRELSKPLIPQHIYDQIGRNVSDVAGIEIIRDILEKIPDPNRATLKFLIRHLKNVAAFSGENRMPASNLAIVWGPCIFSSNQMIFVDIGRMNTLTKLLIENYEYIFRENERLVN
ncbi:PREDICTED: rho GTPase-activating protein 15-like [Rhagoletis zephyria]|uniref:rho GTPase-activating protein 15-like n=1 Tax=Rhagoletis zephyria TaxID=28612 RepID=UPI0008112978|nr:PREDICTED: rho GTPase-activating protein 15-like [Rhagoletis zephyria]